MKNSQARAARLAGEIALLAFAYFVAGRLSLLLAIPPGYASAVWPAAGIGLSALLIFGQRLWPGVVIGSFAANLGVGSDVASLQLEPRALLVPLVIGVGAAVQALAGTALARQLIRRDPALLELRYIVGVLFLAGPLSCAINPTWSIITLEAAGAIDAVEYGFNWMTWWVGDSVGVLMILPIALAWLGEPKAAWRRRRNLVTLPIVLFSAMALGGFLISNHQEQKERAAEFARRSEIIADSLDKHITRYLEVVYGVQSFIASSDRVKREQFRSFVGRTLERVPGIQALSWNPRITADERRDYEANAQRDGAAGFRLTERTREGTLVPAAARPEYVAVYYIEPRAGNEEAMGYDVYSQPTRRAAMDSARDTGRAVATARITLVQENSTQAGVLVFVPVYDTSQTPDGLAQRRAGLRGYAVGVFRLGDVLAAALQGLSTTHVEARLYDASTAGEAVPLAGYEIDHRNTARALAPTEAVVPLGELGYSKHYEVAGRQWRLDVSATRGYLVANRTWVSWGVLAAGLSFASLFGVFLLALTGRWIHDERRATQLVESNNRLVEAERVAELGSWELDLVSQEVHWSEQGRRLFDIAPGVAPTTLEDFLSRVHVEERERTREWMTAARGADAPQAIEFRVVRSSGDLRWMRAQGRTSGDASATPLRFFGTCRDVTERKRADEKIRAALAEKEVLLREVYHRVKNNLQVVSSLLKLQSRRAADVETKRLLDDSGSRVVSMALVHEQLYRAENLSSIGLQNYLRQLAGNLNGVHWPLSERVLLKVEAEELAVGLDSAIPLGLVVNELVTNAYRHGYSPDATGGEIVVRVRGLPGGRVLLEVNDDGRGLPPDFDPGKADSLGMQLVTTLVGQLGGELTWTARHPGTCMRLEFTPAESTSRSTVA